MRKKINVKADLFDISDLSDLPQEASGQICKNPRRTDDVLGGRIREIFTRAGDTEITQDQIFVAYYRLFGGDKTKSQLVAKMGYMLSRKTANFVKVKGKFATYSLV